MLTPDALNRWLDRLGPVRTLTSAADAWLKGYDDTVAAVFSAPAEKKVRDGLLTNVNYVDMREVLDAADDDFYMSRPMAQFYLAMSPKTFKTALSKAPHPFAEPKGGATKGAIDEWFLRRSTTALPAARKAGVKRVRSLDTGRFYLVDQDGRILGDAQINRVGAEGIAHKLSNGGDIRVMSLNAALAMPWADPTERKPWALGRQVFLQRQLEQAQALAQRTHLAIARAKGEDMEATLPAGEPVKRVDPFRV